MAQKKQWCVEKVTGETGYRCLQATNMGSAKTKRFSFSTRTTTENLNGVCKGNLNIVFSPEEYHLFSDTFPKLKPDLLKLQINKRFKDLGVTMDTMGYSHKAKETPNKKNHLNCLFLLDNELETHITDISSLPGVKRAQLYPAAAAVAGLIQAVTTEAVIVLHICNRFSQVIVVKDGSPLYNQSLAQTGPGLVEEALIPNAVDFARLNVSKDHGIDHFLITTFGEARENISLAQIGIEEWQPDFSSAIQSDDPEGPLKYPQLYGIPFSDQAYDFIPAEFIQAWQLQSLSKTVSIFAALLCLVLGSGWYYLQPILETQKTQYNKLLNELSQKKQTLQQRLPQATLLNNFDRLVKIRSLASEDFRLGSLAKNLSSALPQKVRITNLEVRRQKSDTVSEISAPPVMTNTSNDPGLAPLPESTTELSIPEKIQGQSIVIAITCGTEGSYGEVTTRFEKAAQTLSGYYGLENLTWSYREAEKIGVLRCELYPPPKEIQQ